MRSTPISRRDLLRRYGPAAALAWPVFSATRVARAQAKLRFITFFSSSGVRQNIFWPKGTPGDAASGNWTLDGTSLRALKPFMNDIVIPRGVAINRGGGDSHNAGSVSCLTGRDMISENVNEKFAAGESLDHYLSTRISGTTPEKFFSLGVRLQVNRVSKYVSFDAGANKIEPTQDPYQLYDRIFRNLIGNCSGTGSGSATVSDELARVRFRRKSVLDALLKQTADFKRQFGVSAEEARKVDQMETGIRTIERRIDSLMAPVAVPAGASCSEIKAAMESAAKVANTDDNYPKLLTMFLDLMGLAAELDITRVMTISLSLGGSGGAPMRWLQWKDGAGRLQPIDASHHNVSHGLDRQVQNYQEKLEVIDAWNFEQFAYLLGRLKSVSEGAGTILDNSIVWYATDVGQGDSHNDSSCPFIFAGKAGGAMRTGRYFQAPSWAAHQALLTDIARYMGQNVTWGKQGAVGGRLL